MFLETTNSIYDDAIYELCSTSTVMTWIRAPVAGRLARDAEEFSTVISKYNSGTYNNQWVVVDLAKFENNSNDNIIWVMEQLPGKTTSYDATERLKNTSYFPSYNIPSQIEFRIISGYPAKQAVNNSLSYD